MKDNKTIGFDILDNAGLDEIDKIGTDTDMLDEKTKKRILEMTRKRFNDAIKGEDMMTFNNDINGSAEIVENVEVYKRSKISKIMTRVINTAAVAGIAAGSVFLVKNINKDNKPVDPDLPATSTTESVELTAEEKARNQRIEEYIEDLCYNYGTSDEDLFYESIKIDYAYVDINGDSVSELLIRYDNIDAFTPYNGAEINYFDGTKYVPVRSVYHTYKFDLENHKVYQYSESHEGISLITFTCKNSKFFDLNEVHESQDYYYYGIETNYTHNDEECTKVEFESAISEYKNCVGAELNFIPYTVKRESAEKTARNQRIEEYIQELYNQFGMSDEDRFYDCLKIDYAYLDINNDSVDELFIRYDFLEAAADAKGIGLNYFDGTKYVHFDEIYDASDMAKIDLQNRRLYEIHEGHEPGYYTYVKTWENVEFSDNKDFFRVQDTYCSNMITYEPEEYSYTHNDLPCTKEEYERAWAEYENCVGAELKFFPYDVKKANGQLSQEETARNQRIEGYIQELYNCIGDQCNDEGFYNNLKIDYAYLDINNDSVSELLIRYDFINSAADSTGMSINYFDGTNYVQVYDAWGTVKFDLNNRKLYELSQNYLNENILGTSTWENIEFSDNTAFFTSQDSYHPIESEEADYYHNNEPCTKEEYDKAIAEYENCVGAELDFIPYTIKKNQAAVNGQQAIDLSQEEPARNQRIEDFIRHIYVSHNEVLDKETFDETLKIEYAYLDINNDSIDELLIRYDFLKSLDYSGVEFNYFNGTEYEKFDVLYGNTIKFDVPNRKLYEKYDGYENEFLMDVKIWENVEISSDKSYFTTQNNYHCYMSVSNPDEIVYTRDGVEYPESEFKKVQAEFENLSDTKLNYINYVPDDSFFLENSVNNTANGQSAEETARNKRIEEYIDYLCYYCDGESDKDKFYDTIKIDYAYLDINNDSVDELLIRYHNLNDFSPYYEGTEINYFNGTKYIPVGETNTTFKFDLQNRKLYQLSEGHEGGYWLCVRTWDEFSDDADFFTLTDNYTSDIISFEPLEYTYSHNDTECTMEEYEKAIDEYENCVGAEVNYIPYI